jgi:hypothetical protein
LVAGDGVEKKSGHQSKINQERAMSNAEKAEAKKTATVCGLLKDQENQESSSGF